MNEDTLRRLAGDISKAADEAHDAWVTARNAWYSDVNASKGDSVDEREHLRQLGEARGRVDAYNEAWRLVQSYRDGGQA